MATSPLKIMCVAGARPNFMKIKPVVDALESRGATVLIVHTGQHYDENMSDVFFRDLGMRTPDYRLAIAPGSSMQQSGEILAALEPIMASIRPSAVVVCGDVNSTMAAAIVASHLHIPVAHVEAGLRSRDWDMPEEVNRVIADALATWLFAPSSDAVENLRAEGVHEDRIVLAGNVMIDTLLSNVTRARQRDVVGRMGLSPRDYGLVTLHRPANVDDDDTFDHLVSLVNQAATRLPLVFPVHPRTAKRVTTDLFSSNVTLTEPLGYLDFLALQDSARVVLTDSGGIQEETTALGVPCLTLRDSTERPITITEGTNRLVGTDLTTVLAALDDILTSPQSPRSPALWDGHASDRIADSLLGALASGEWRHPTAVDGNAS